LVNRRKKEEGRRKKKEERRKKKEGRRKKTYAASFVVIRILRLIRWIYLSLDLSNLRVPLGKD
jgi:hypothetical protein